MTKEYILDGSRVTSLETFYNEVDRTLGLPIGSTPNLDWLDDLLSGVVEGIPDDGIALRWTNSGYSRQQLGSTFDRLQDIIQRNSNVSLLLE